MTRTRVGFRFALAAIAAASCIAALPLSAMAQAASGSPQPTRSQAPGTLVVQQVENGPAFGVEFKFSEINRQDAYLLGGYAGYTFDNTLFVGGAGYWQVNTWSSSFGWDGCGHGCGGFGGATGYGGVVVEWFPVRTHVIALSARGLVGGGVTTVLWSGRAFVDERWSSGRHGTTFPPISGAFWYDQGYFVFEPQANVTVRIAPGVSLAGGIGYRVIGWSNGWDDQIGGLTGSFAIRFGR
jgi:hypothetical protein